MENIVEKTEQAERLEGKENQNQPDQLKYGYTLRRLLAVFEAKDRFDRRHSNTNELECEPELELELESASDLESELKSDSEFENLPNPAVNEWRTLALNELKALGYNFAGKFL